MNSTQHDHLCAKRWGGRPDDYSAVNEWFDESKMIMADFRHRALRHHAEGVFMCERIFGRYLRVGLKKQIRVPVRLIAETHIIEDLGFIPSMQDWFRHITLQPWMLRTKAAKIATVEINRKSKAIAARRVKRD